jgi:DNA polymerase-3 subunit delta
MAKSGKTTFRESVEQYGALMSAIAGRKFARLYLLMGEEPYFIDRLGDRLAATILDETAKAFNQTVVYGKDTEGAAVVNLCRQMPMMGGTQVVIVREAQQLKKIEQLTGYTQSPQPSTILILCHKGKNLDKRTPLYKSLAAGGEVFESVPPRDYEIGGWLTDFVRTKGLSLDAKASAMLVDHLGADVGKIAGELDKLLTSLPEGTRQVTADHIEQYIGISKEFNTFELNKALSEKNLPRAMQIANYFARNPKDNPFVVTISQLFTHFQRIFILNYQRWLAKKEGRAMPAELELSRMLKLPAPFFLREYQTAAGHYPTPKVFAIMGLLREYDLKSKGAGSGSADDGELLKELLLKIMIN